MRLDALFLSLANEILERDETSPARTIARYDNTIDQGLSLFGRWVNQEVGPQSNRRNCHPGTRFRRGVRLLSLVQTKAIT